MGKQNDELERLRKLRERQLQARDPHAKQRTVQRKVTARRRKKRKQGSFLDVVTDVPYKWQGIVIGALAGAIIWIVLPLVVNASWVDFAGPAAIIVLAIVGFFFGQAFDVRDELRDLIE